MWVRLIVLLAPPSGMSVKMVLNVFETYEACQPERNRIEMAKSYPNESEFRIVCAFREKKPSQRSSRQELEQQASLTDKQL